MCTIFDISVQQFVLNLIWTFKRVTKSLTAYPYSTKDMQTRSLRIEWKINFPIFPIFFLSYGWLYLKFTGDTPRFSSVSPIKNKIVQKWSNLQKSYTMSWNDWKINFPIYIFWVMVDFILKIHRKMTNFKYKIGHI